MRGCGIRHQQSKRQMPERAQQEHSPQALPVYPAITKKQLAHHAGNHRCHCHTHRQQGTYTASSLAHTFSRNRLTEKLLQRLKTQQQQNNPAI